MKTLEIKKTESANPRLTVAVDRITIKHDHKRDYTLEIEFLKGVAAQLSDCPITARGNLYKGLLIMRDGCKKNVIAKFSMDTNTP